MNHNSGLSFFLLFPFMIMWQHKGLVIVFLVLLSMTLFIASKEFKLPLTLENVLKILSVWILVVLAFGLILFFNIPFEPTSK